MAGCQKAVGADRARGKAYAIRFLRRLAENITLVGQSASVVVTKIGINLRAVCRSGRAVIARFSVHIHRELWLLRNRSLPTASPD